MKPARREAAHVAERHRYGRFVPFGHHFATDHFAVVRRRVDDGRRTTWRMAPSADREYQLTLQVA